MKKVVFNYADVRTVNLAGKRKVQGFIGDIFKRENKEFENLQFIFCSDEYLLQINKDFLQHDYYTDIITFDLSEGENEIIGELYISIDRVKDNAITHSVSFREELLRVLFHGALHLCGYKDKKKSEITIMREKEDYYLRLFEKK